jgi:hypothetical protein
MVGSAVASVVNYFGRNVTAEIDFTDLVVMPVTYGHHTAKLRRKTGVDRSFSFPKSRQGVV